MQSDHDYVCQLICDTMASVLVWMWRVACAVTANVPYSRRFAARRGVQLSLGCAAWFILCFGCMVCRSLVFVCVYFPPSKHELCCLGAFPNCSGTCPQGAFETLSQEVHYTYASTAQTYRRRIRRCHSDPYTTFGNHVVS